MHCCSSALRQAYVKPAALLASPHLQAIHVHGRLAGTGHAHAARLHARMPLPVVGGLTQPEGEVRAPGCSSL